VTLLRTILADWKAPLQRDPAANGYLDVLLSYPGFQAVTAHRFVHLLYRARVPLLPRFLAYLVRMITGIDIHPGARLGSGLFIDHGMGVVIGETAEVGDNVTLLQGVTLGGTHTMRVKRHPTLGDNVLVGADAIVLGAVTIGDNAKIGAGSVVVKDVPANSTVVGIPAHVVLQNGVPVAAETRDASAVRIAQLADRISALEFRLAQLNGTVQYDDVSP
jgi:serine O-acetyltransferase